ncbi:MAG: hypothetical protein AAFY63_19905 [Cyanobacteria bacterium J06643_13]
MNDSVIRLLALSTINLIAVYGLANEPNIPTVKQARIPLGDRNSLIQTSSSHICISSCKTAEVFTTFNN